MSPFFFLSLCDFSVTALSQVGADRKSAKETNNPLKLVRCQQIPLLLWLPLFLMQVHSKTLRDIYFKKVFWSFVCYRQDAKCIQGPDNPCSGDRNFLWLILSSLFIVTLELSEVNLASYHITIRTYCLLCELMDELCSYKAKGCDTVGQCVHNLEWSCSTILLTHLNYTCAQIYSHTSRVLDCSPAIHQGTSLL